MLLSVQLSAERMSQDHHTPFNISCWLHLKDETVFSPLKKKKKHSLKYIFLSHGHGIILKANMILERGF